MLEGIGILKTLVEHEVFFKSKELTVISCRSSRFVSVCEMPRSRPSFPQVLNVHLSDTAWISHTNTHAPHCIHAYTHTNNLLRCTSSKQADFMLV